MQIPTFWDQNDDKTDLSLLLALFSKIYTFMEEIQLGILTIDALVNKQNISNILIKDMK